VTLRLIVSPEAEEDLEEIFLWYDRQSERLGMTFLTRFEQALRRLERLPYLYAEVYKGGRLARIDRFPHRIVYSVDDQKTTVLAVWHPHQDPEKWQRRMT
jgi:plasmid stabilization system protein ParE